jgi:hypothetical protein
MTKHDVLNSGAALDSVPSLSGRRHPERSRFPGGVKDLTRIVVVKLRYPLVTLLLICLCGTAMLGQAAPPASDPPASRDDIFKLFDVMQVRSQMTSMMSQVMAQMRSLNRAQMKKQNPGITEADLAKVDAKSEELLKSMPIEGMLDDMVPVYQKHLAKSDVDAMIAFYATPTGQKLLREMPVIAAEGMQAMQPRLIKQMDEIRRKVEEPSKPDATQPSTTASPAPK